MEHHQVQLKLDVPSEGEVVEADKQYTDLSLLLTDVTDFIKQFGHPDRGDQTITITILSLQRTVS
jgi:hypothetical protein